MTQPLEQLHSNPDITNDLGEAKNSLKEDYALFGVD